MVEWEDENVLQENKKNLWKGAQTWISIDVQKFHLVYHLFLYRLSHEPEYTWQQCAIAPVGLAPIYRVEKCASKSVTLKTGNIAPSR